MLTILTGFCLISTFSVPLNCPYTVKIKYAVFEIMYLVARKVSKREMHEMVYKVVSLGLS